MSSTIAGELVLYGRAEEDPILPYGPLTQAIRQYVRSRSELTPTSGC